MTYKQVIQEVKQMPEPWNRLIESFFIDICKHYNIKSSNGGRPKIKLDIEEICILKIERGLSYRCIAKAKGVDHTTIYKRLKAEGLI